MQRVLFVIPSLDPGGAARQLSLLAAGLPRDRVTSRVCVLGAASAWGDDLRTAGVAVDFLGRTRSFDVLPFLALRRLLRSCDADVVHVWGAEALRAVALLRGTRGLWVSGALPPLGAPGRIDRWLLRRAGRIIAFGTTDAERYRALGVERIAVVPPAAAVSPSPQPLSSEYGGETLRFSGRVVLGIGPLFAHKGVRDAVWTADVLHFLFPDLDLVLVGDPPPPRVLAGLSHVGRIHLVGRCRHLAPYLQRAEVVWVPGRAGGVSAALEAMAAGKPVVAARSPQMAELIEDGVTGLFFTPGDKADLARQTRRLLDDEALRRTMGEAAQQRAVKCFAPANLIEQYLTLLHNPACKDVRSRP